MLEGILPDTPLGQIVAIRSETDKKVLKNFTKNQRKIHNEWKFKVAKAKENDPEQLDREMQSLAFALRRAFGS
jgi:hypothetical protein